MRLGATLVAAAALPRTVAAADTIKIGVVLLYNLLHVGFVGAGLLLLLPAFAAGLLVYHYVIRQVAKAKRTSAPEHAQLLATLGLSLVIQNGSEMIWGSTPRTLGSTQELGVWRIGTLTIDQPRTVALLVALAIGAAMLFVLRRTHLGRSVRAAASDREAAGYVGVDVARDYAGTFAVAITLSVIVGAVLVPALVRSHDPHAAAGAAWAALDETGLGARAHVPVSGLYTGKLRRLELARAMVTVGPGGLLLLDEFLGGLTTADGDVLLAALRRWRERGGSVLAIEHTMRAMAGFVDRFVVLNFGEVIANSSPNEICANREVVKAYLGDKWVA